MRAEDLRPHGALRRCQAHRAVHLSGNFCCISSPVHCTALCTRRNTESGKEIGHCAGAEDAPSYPVRRAGPGARHLNRKQLVRSAPLIPSSHNVGHCSVSQASSLLCSLTSLEVPRTHRCGVNVNRRRRRCLACTGLTAPLSAREALIFFCRPSHHPLIVHRRTLADVDPPLHTPCTYPPEAVAITHGYERHI